MSYRAIVLERKWGRGEGKGERGVGAQGGRGVGAKGLGVGVGWGSGGAQAHRLDLMLTAEYMTCTVLQTWHLYYSLLPSYKTVVVSGVIICLADPFILGQLLQQVIPLIHFIHPLFAPATSTCCPLST
ncbi:hypothetical protein Droror1_Dr00011698 [Drosera rotundifolia]